MNAFKLISRFSRDESGAVTVDWVVLTAAIVGLAIGIVALVQGGVTDLAENISSGLSAITLPNTGTGTGN